jgi:type I restriction enzyme M protein
MAMDAIRVATARSGERNRRGTDLRARARQGHQTRAREPTQVINQSEKVNFIWSVKEILRDHYKRHQYGEVILPFCVLRRLDCVLEPTKPKVVAKASGISGDLDTQEGLLAHTAGQPFYNTSKFTFAGLLGDQHNITANVHDYVNGFSPNTRDALEKFGLARHIDKMGDAGILYMVTQRFAEIDLHPDKVSNLEMGYIYEELIRVTADLSNEEAGEHFTPREVIELMVNLLFADEEQLLTPGKIAKLYDPACGTGGMLSVAEEHLRRINPKAKLHLYGQEIQPESYAVCRSDMLLKGQDASKIVFGDSFTQDGFAAERFDYMLANPPFGKDWKTIEANIKREHKGLGYEGRFGAGLPGTADGQILFLQQMISKMRSPGEGGSRAAIVFNGSPLFSGDAGLGMSEIRRWIIEHDWLETIVGLPDQLFYNTGIYTYVWVVTNRKRAERRGHVQLIDARDLYVKMRKSLGNKRNELSSDQIAEVTHVYEAFVESDRSKILPNSAFGYRKITVERPLRVHYEITVAAVDALSQSQRFAKLGDADAATLRDVLCSLAGTSYASIGDLDAVLKPILAKIGAPTRKAIIAAFIVRDPEADPVHAKGGDGYEPDPELRDTETVPIDEDIDAFMDREVVPFVPDSWVDRTKTKVGYEIPFTRHFYKYAPPRPLGEIDAEIKASQQRILKLLAEVTE